MTDLYSGLEASIATQNKHAENVKEAAALAEKFIKLSRDGKAVEFLLMKTWRSYSPGFVPQFSDFLIYFSDVREKRTPRKIYEVWGYRPDGTERWLSRHLTKEEADRSLGLYAGDTYIVSYTEDV